MWDDDELETRRRESIADFITERSEEGSARYREIFARNLRLVETLFDQTDDLREFSLGTALATNPGLIEAARYLGGPPVSADDLNTLAETSIAKRKRIDADLARKAAQVIGAFIDPERFAWLFETPIRSPTPGEREMAMRWTAGLQTVREIGTARRRESSTRQQLRVEQLLGSLDFSRVGRRTVRLVDDLARGEFCPESEVAGAKCDVPVRLHDGRLLLIECKVSNSGTNSVKRLIRETAGKAGHWRTHFGAMAVTAAVLAGVYKLRNLRAAQDMGAAIFWERDLLALSDFVRTSS
jgi:hypothetical protein